MMASTHDLIIPILGEAHVGIDLQTELLSPEELLLTVASPGRTSRFLEIHPIHVHQIPIRTLRLIYTDRNDVQSRSVEEERNDIQKSDSLCSGKR